MYIMLNDRYSSVSVQPRMPADYPMTRDPLCDLNEAPAWAKTLPIPQTDSDR